jgi:HEPN domain-containing protein
VPQIGENDYRDGARERLVGARKLLQSGQLAEAVYLSGRAVEGMFRALIWKSEPDYRSGRKPLGVGHNPRDLLALIGSLGLLSGRDDAMWFEVQLVSIQ